MKLKESLIFIFIYGKLLIAFNIFRKKNLSDPIPNMFQICLSTNIWPGKINHKKPIVYYLNRVLPGVPKFLVS